MEPAKNKKKVSLKPSARLVLGTCVVFLSGCAAPQLHPLNGRGEGKNMEHEQSLKIITAGENGQEFKMAAGETFQLSLAENPTTGYQWAVAGSSTPVVELEKEEYFAPKNDPARPIMGQGGVKLLTFKALNPGETELVLHLRRSWEAESEFVESFSIVIKVLELKK